MYAPLHLVFFVTLALTPMCPLMLSSRYGWLCMMLSIRYGFESWFAIATHARTFLCETRAHRATNSQVCQTISDNTGSQSRNHPLVCHYLLFRVILGLLALIEVTVVASLQLALLHRAVARQSPQSTPNQQLQGT